ncbi:MAG: GIY-YIG nuclease family protein [Rickettsiales bacterium]
MKYVYILQSEAEPDRYYTGSTTDLKRRYKEHNDGKSIHTKK